MNRAELLAPAGGMEQLKAAVRFGADAVYGGMKRFGLRAFAGNFSPQELQEAVSYTHERNVKFYVTMNMLPSDRDLPGFLQAAEEAEKSGVDAAIIADPGAALMVHQHLPGLKIHISTQANVMNSVTAEWLRKSAGASRVILSRELSMGEIRLLREKTDPSLELEAFVHGAMCVSYSGRCLLSAALTGRSGNRGACAQPCRWKYTLMEEKRPGEYFPVEEDENGTYLFSAPDLCMIGHLHELKQAGVCSFKVEGRMKTAYYVASVISVYRRALDVLELEGEEAYLAAVPELQKELEKASHRLSNTGFYFGMPSPPGGADGFSQTMEYVADVTASGDEKKPARIRLKNRFYAQDELEVLSPQGVQTFVPGKILNPETGESRDTVSVAGTEWLIPVPFPVEAGDLLRGPNRNHRS